jgi:hypothetical protein
MDTVVARRAYRDHVPLVMGVVDVPLLDVMYLGETIRAAWIGALSPTLVDKS